MCQFCGSAIWAGDSWGSLSLLHSIWGLGWENVKAKRNLMPESSGRAWCWLLAGTEDERTCGLLCGWGFPTAWQPQGHQTSAWRCSPRAGVQEHRGICVAHLGSHIASLLPHPVGQSSHKGRPRSKERGGRPDPSTGVSENL